MNAPSAPEFSEVSWHPFLPCEFFCKGSLLISEDTFTATVLHAQQTWLPEPQERLQSSLQLPGEGSLLGGGDLGSAPTVSSADPSHGDLTQVEASPRVSVSRCSQGLALHVSWVDTSLGRGAQQLQPGLLTFQRTASCW